MRPSPSAHCPLWVRTGHSAPLGPMSASRQKRTLVVIDDLGPNCLREDAA